MDLRSLRESYEIKINEYENLMDLKIQLDQEIATYRALLQEEENRWVCLCKIKSIKPIPSMNHMASFLFY